MLLPLKVSPNRVGGRNEVLPFELQTIFVQSIISYHLRNQPVRFRLRSQSCSKQLFSQSHGHNSSTSYPVILLNSCDRPYSRNDRLYPLILQVTIPTLPSCPRSWPCCSRLTPTPPTLSVRSLRPTNCAHWTTRPRSLIFILKQEQLCIYSTSLSLL